VFLQSLQGRPWKHAWCSPSREYLGWGCCLLNNRSTSHIGEDGEQANPWANPSGT
jgi:hypothetical protein